MSHAHYDQKVYCSLACMTADYRSRFADMTYSRTDANQQEIIDALRGVGCLVWDLSDAKHGVPDLLVCRGGVLYLVEVKTAQGALTKAQKEFIAQGWPVHVVRSVEEALRAVGLAFSVN